MNVNQYVIFYHTMHHPLAPGGSSLFSFAAARGHRSHYNQQQRRCIRLLLHAHRRALPPADGRLALTQFR
jgi:hypothetical protein